MYASFLLKYSKSYLHTCIIFYMFTPFIFPSMPCARTCHILSRFGYTPLPDAFFFETPRHLYPLFLYQFICSFSLAINVFYLSLVLLGTDHQR